MNLTDEQEAVVQSNSDLKINAVAGSGKTSTLLAYAKANKDKKILYLAFNKSVKEEATSKFRQMDLPNVRVETAHSLAYNYIRSGRGIKLKSDGYSSFEIRAKMRIAFGDLIKEMKVASHVLKLSSCFCNSSLLKVADVNYLDQLYGSEAQFAKENYEKIQHYSRLFLAEMHKGNIPIIHDFYLKQYQLKHPTLLYDIFLFDEGQDASSVMLEVFLNQNGRKIIVGDEHQQIYSWRFATNALKKVSYPQLNLTKSFRFPQDIADLAMEVLNQKQLIGETVFPKIKGTANGKHDSLLSRSVLGRTNSGLLVEAISQLVEEKTIKTLYFEGNFNSYTYADQNGSVYDVLNLYLGKRHRLRHPMIKSMENIDQLKEYAEDTNDAPLKGIIEIVLKYKRELPKLIDEIKHCQVEDEHKDQADMIFSTIHKAKGMEYDEVSLINDFMTEEKLDEILEGNKGKELDLARLNGEINLLYVGITRTRDVLNIPNHLIPRSLRISEPHAKQVTNDHPKEKIRSNQSTPNSLPAEKTYTYDEVRKKYAGAYKKWTPEDDDELIVLFCNAKTIQEMSEHFGRTQGSISSRIKKLELWDKYG